jgi:hypothetical protein
MLNRLRSVIREAIWKRCDAYLHSSSRDLDLTRERVAAEESAIWLNRNASVATSCANRFELLRHSVSAVTIKGLICEFGVYRGDTINYLSSLFPTDTLHGFDSFEGLPEGWRAGFERGCFRCEGMPDVRPNVLLHKGLFHESLPLFLRDHEGDISFLHIDCDLYSSTRIVLELLGERIVPGTVIQLDEFLNYPGWQLGESRAFSEFCAVRDVQVEYLGYVVRDEQVALRVTVMSNSPADHLVSGALRVLAGAGNP